MNTPTNTLKVAIVHRDLHELTRGGICTVFRNVATELVALGHEVVLITARSQTPLRPMDGISVVELPRTDDLDAHRRMVADALDDLEDIDIVEASSWEAELLHYVRRPREQRRPVVIRADLSARTMHIRHHAEAEAEVIAAADAVSAVGRWTGEDIRQAYGVRPRVIPNGVDRTLFSPGPRTAPISSGNIIELKPTQPDRGRITSSRSLADQAPDTDSLWNRVSPGPDRPRLIWVGKATEMKGWDLLQQSARALRGQAAITVVLGHGWFEYDITLGDEPHVQVLQDLDVHDLVSLYRSADWVLSTSRWEGFHLSFAEALNCGIPGLAPGHLGAAHDLITPHENGLFYRNGGELPDLLARAPRLTGSLDPAFDWVANAHATADLYIHVLTQHDKERN